MNDVADWSRAFVLTWFVELMVAVPLLGAHEPRWRRLTVVSLAQLASHPAVWFIFPALHWRRFPYLLVSEVWAMAIELLLYRLVFTRLSWTRAFGISALANGASFALGSLLG
jgi:hypothetical protein